MSSSLHERDGVSKAIQQFNRQCEEERVKRAPIAPKKFEKRIQNYGIDMNSLIGEGTFSKVYRGRELGKSNQVAVKMVELKKIEEMGIQQLFWEELSIVKRLKHPNIVSCFEYFRTTNNCYTIYEYCEGGDLTSLLKKGPLFDKEDLLQANAIIKDVFQGLLYLQSMNIVHRDIKAANILLSKGKAKIGDFGFATRCNSEFRDASIGSPAYMAPQGLVNNIYGPKTDVWAFGMLIYEIIHGQSPFCECESQKQLRKRVQIPVNWDQLKGILPSPLKRLILKCLRVDLQERPSFSELLNDEYIQKIYKDSTSRHSSKSTYTRKTADSQGLNINNSGSFEKVRDSRNVQIHQKYRENKQKTKRIPTEVEQSNKKPIKQCETERALQGKEPIFMQTLKTEAYDDEEPLDAPFDMNFDNNQQIVQSNIQPAIIQSYNQKSYKIDEFKIDKYLILKQDQKENELIDWFEALKIICQAVNSCSQILKINLIDLRTFMNQLLLQLYKASSTADLIEQLLIFSQKVQELQQPYDANFNELLTNVTENIFQQIKQVERIIDHQDIYGERNDQQEAASMIQCGNLLAKCYCLCSTITPTTTEYLQNWLETYSRKTESSSQQFYIWLYEIELRRME